nr:phage tail protein [uncultured Campylobacter sp.]
MANIKEEKTWEEGIYQLEVTDPVVGGIDGISNKQAKQLANRTSYLKKQVEDNKSGADLALATKRDVDDSYSKTEVDKKFTSVGTTIAEKLDKEGTAADSAKLGGLAADKYALKSEASDGLKIGSYLLWSSDRTTPAGFLPCDGRRLVKSEYIELFNVIGYTYGGNGEHFNLPKFNDGKFIRGTGGNAASLGIAQGDAIRNITGGFGDISGVYGEFHNPTGAFTNNQPRKKYTSGGWTEDNKGMGFDASKQVPVAPENRPYNMSVIILIKVKNVFEATNIDKSPYATETKAGIVKLKNSITGNLSDTAVSEKAVSDAFSTGFLSSKQQNGYTKLLNGIMLQWGRVKDLEQDARKNLTFPISFPNACLNASATYIADSSFSQAGGVMYVANITKTGMTIEYQTVDNDASNFPKRDAFWFAIGY